MLVAYGGAATLTRKPILTWAPPWPARFEKMSDLADEKDCLLCGEIPASERDAFRASLDKLPLDEPVCDECLMAWWRNLGLPVSNDKTTKH
jgi:hypothetical protein